MKGATVNIKTTAVLSAALLLSACGGAEPESEAVNNTTTSSTSATHESAGQPVTQADVDALGKTLGKAWGVDCGDSVVDMAGYPKVTCIIPDRLMTPGSDGNAVSVMTFKKWRQADTYVASYGDPKITVVKNGYIVDGPTSKSVNAAVQALEKD